MLSPEQIKLMLMARKDNGTLFSQLPLELIKELSNYGYDKDSDSEIGGALHHAAYARKEDVDVLLAMLEKNPALLLHRGNVITPGGDELKRVTIYECLLGAGDFELAKKVQGYFAEIKINNIDGEQERIKQYELYRPHIESMLQQKPYDLTSLIELIKLAESKEISALLNKETCDTPLGNALIQFRKDWAPRIVTEPCMHYNYKSLYHAFDILNSEWNNLYQASKQH